MYKNIKIINKKGGIEKMKKFLSLIAITSLLAIAPVVSADNTISVNIDGTPVEFDVPPMIINDRTMVPMRATLEMLGADVSWDDTNRVATGIAPGISVQIPIDSDVIYRSTIEIPTDSPATIIDGRTLIPLRVVSECFGMNVAYDESTHTVNITNKNSIGSYNWNSSHTYYGELSNGEPDGYGELYNDVTGQIEQIGLYKNGEIIRGTDIYSDGSMFQGTYKNGAINNGTYYYASGDSFEGSFDNEMKNGYGTYHWSDGVSVYGYFENDKINGLCTYYNPDGTVKYTTTMYNGMTAKEAYETEKINIDNEYINKLTEIYGLQSELYELQTTDPYSTDEAKEILRKYNLSNYTNTIASNGGSIDSYSAANAMRQQAALYSQAQQAILNAYNAKIENMQKIIDALQKNVDNWYNDSIKALKIKYNIS